MNAWDQSIGLPPVQTDTVTVDHVLNLSVQAVRELDMDAAYAYAFTLAQFAFQLQRRTNQCQSFLTWARFNKSKIVADGLGPRLTQLVEQATIHIERISYLARRVEFMADILTKIHRTKRTES
jgi:hypothetical protein